ncbi:MAG: hypothetical protein KDC92_15750, partial [Bacteroidetes bacterium]|nr:hypothetical protein [Bacteroidota bacterium]
MKRKLLLPISFLVVSWCQAQSLSPVVIGTAGNTGSSGSASLSWTIGEPVITTESGSSNTLTQGFHQYYSPGLVSIESYNDESISIYPNPTKNQVVISTSTSEMNGWTATVISALGETVLTQNLNGQSTLL